MIYRRDSLLLLFIRVIINLNRIQTYNITYICVSTISVVSEEPINFTHIILRVVVGSSAKQTTQ